MNVYTKIRFILIDIYYNLKNKFRNNYERMSLNIKYSPFFTKIFFRLNNKTLLILIITYILFITIQLSLFSIVFKPQKNNISKDLTKCIYSYKNIGHDFEIKLRNYTFDLENFTKEISVPFYLNWIIDLQKKLSRQVKIKKNIKTIFIFNHHGRLLNFAPNIEKLRNSNYQFTPYLKKAFKHFRKKKTSLIYYYTDSDVVLKKYKLNSTMYIEKSKNYINEPFYSKKLFKKSDISSDREVLNMHKIFNNQNYVNDHVPYVMIFTPIYNQLKKIIGIAGYNIDVDEIFKQTLSDNSQQFSTIIINKKGMIVYSLNKKLIGRYVLHNNEIKNILNSKEETIKIKKKIYIKYKLNIDRRDWYMITRINPVGQAFSLSDTPLSNPILYLFFLLEALIFICLYILFKKHISKPISNFSINLKNLSKGESISKIKLNHHDEFKLIENRFNNLTDKVKGYLVFGKTVSKELVDEYFENQVSSNIPAEEKNGTILHLKIKNLDQLKSSMSNEDFDILLNKFLNDVEIFVSKYKGFIDHFGSDSILSIFGVPFNGYNHSQNAYECAKKILHNRKLFNKVNKVNIEISVGINTGDIFYSQMHSNYGKLLVSLGKTITKTCYYDSITNPNVLSISETTMDHLSPKPKMKKAIYLKVKGETEPHKIYLKSI